LNNIPFLEFLGGLFRKIMIDTEAQVDFETVL